MSSLPWHLYVSCSFALDKSTMKTLFVCVIIFHLGVISTNGLRWKSYELGFNCHAYQSCASDYRSCHCDSFCPYFGDCCEDYERNRTTSVPVDWKNKFPENHFLQCRSIPGYKNPPGVSTDCPEETYWMVSRCPASTLRTLKEQCEKEYSIKDLVKVSFLRPVHDALGNVFKNYYCAKCNGIPFEEITLWSVNQVCTQCPDKLPLSQNHYVNLSSPYCDFSLEIPFPKGYTNASEDVYARLRWCDKDMIRSCPSGSDSNDNKMCSEFMSPGYFRGSYFKNIFCAKCHGLADLHSWSCEDLKLCRVMGVLPVSFGIAFYDPICSLIRCSRPYTLCDTTSQFISLVVDDNLKCAYLEERAERCFFQKSMLRNITLSWKKMFGTNPLIEANGTRKHDVAVFQLPLNTSTDWRIQLDQDLVMDARLLSQTERSCYLDYIEVVEICSDQEWTRLGECSGELMEIKGDKILDDKYFLTELKHNLTADMSPVWYSVHTRFPFEARSYAEKYTLVCLEAMSKMEERSVWYKAFSGLCIGLTIMAHFATLVTYVAFKPLRNTFGVSLMSFVTSLAIALCLQEFVNDYVINITYLCKAVAIVSHFFWIACFSWMTVLAWDLRATLSLTKVRLRKPSSKRRLGAYCCFGWGVPIVVVSTCMIMWLWNFHGLAINYGPVGDFTCWISDDVITVVAVGGPLVLCLIANAIQFSIIGRSLYMHKKSNKVLDMEKDPKQHRSKVIELMVYMKISMLMGFSWIFGILADFTKVDFLWWLFYLSYLVQAVLIFVFFGLSPRARKMWRSASTTSTKITSAR